ncbi:MAG: hypothetical protein H0W61_10485 [Bacteroidetes bacterium]|nr:hypothetical protein [Bacteroidota bacterium]
MTLFELPVSDGKPEKIVDFHLDLVVSPPQIEEKTIITVDPYILDNPACLRIDYKDAPVDEGHLNIYLCHFKTGKARLHIFGKIKGQEFRAEKEVKLLNTSLMSLQERIKQVLVSSRNILRSYYVNANIKSLEAHLIAFLVPAS